MEERGDESKRRNKETQTAIGSIEQNSGDGRQLGETGWAKLSPRTSAKREEARQHFKKLHRESALLDADIEWCRKQLDRYIEQPRREMDLAKLDRRLEEIRQKRSPLEKRMRDSVPILLENIGEEIRDRIEELRQKRDALDGQCQQMMLMVSERDKGACCDTTEDAVQSTVQEKNGNREDVTSTEIEHTVDNKDLCELEDVLEPSPAAITSEEESNEHVESSEKKRIALSAMDGSEESKRRRLGSKECSVCLEKFWPMGTPFKLLLEAPCGHTLCSRCAFQACVLDEGQCCPTCRMKIDPADLKKAFR